MMNRFLSLSAALIFCASSLLAQTYSATYSSKIIFKNGTNLLTLTPTGLSESFTLKLPIGSGLEGQVLGLVGADDQLGWVSPGVSGTAGGDLGGSYPNPEVLSINGKTLGTNTVAPADNAILIYNATAGQWQAHSLAASVTVNSTNGNVSITDGIVTFAKIQNITDNRLLGRSSGSNGPMEHITVGSGLSLSGGVLSVTGGSGWGLTGNAGTTAGTNFLGTTDFKAMHIYVNGGSTNSFILNTASGIQRDNGGDARGGNAIDMQFGRSAATQVASGIYSVISGGVNNTASGQYSTIGGGTNNTASNTNATVGGGSINTASAIYSTIGGGLQNTATGTRATVAGGLNNNATGGDSFIGGGSGNNASTAGTTIAGGFSNTVSATYSTLSGGSGNNVSASYSVIGGGSGNKVTDEYSTISGGILNQAGDDAGATTDKSYATVAGGNSNMATGVGSSIGGGIQNTSTAMQTTVAGGWLNTATANQSFIGGGFSHVASGTASTVSGGYDNTASQANATVGGGNTNSASGVGSTIAGGQNNTASSSGTTVGGGGLNIASNTNSTVAGGATNTASGNGSTVGGGQSNTANNNMSTVGGGTGNQSTNTLTTVSGGQNNTASGQVSTISGGYGNLASGYTSSISGGISNIASGSTSSIGGGTGNIASGTSSTVGGGSSNTAGDNATVSGGQFNTASADNSTVAGGGNNIAGDNYSTVGGGRENIIYGEWSVIPGGSGLTLDVTADRSFGFLGSTGSRVATISAPEVAFFGNADLWLGNNDGPLAADASQLRFYEPADANGPFPLDANHNYIAFRAPQATTGNLDYVFTLPVDDGTSNQLLQTNGSGILSWMTPSYVTTVIGSYPISVSAGTTPTVSIADAGANSATKGAAAFTSLDFDDNGTGVISLDYVNSQTANSSQNGFLSSTHWTMFDNKLTTVSHDGTLTNTGTSGNPLSVVDNSSTQKVRISNNGTLVGTRQQVNFIPGSNITYSVVENGGADRVDVTINAAAGTVLSGGTVDRLTKWSTGGTNIETSSITDDGSTVSTTSDLKVDGSGKKLIFLEADGTSVTSFTAGVQSSDIDYTLPITAPTADGQFLSSTTAGIMSWTSGVKYDVTSTQNTANINSSKYLFDISYSATDAGANALGARITSTATNATSRNATGLTINATSTSAGTATGLNVTVTGGTLSNDLAAKFNGGGIAVADASATVSVSAGDAATVNADQYTSVEVISDGDATDDVITINGGNNGQLLFIYFSNTGNNDISIGGSAFPVTNNKSAGLTLCRINGTWRVVGFVNYP